MPDFSGPLPAASVGDDLREAADAAGLVYVSDDDPGYTRRKSGTGFAYLSPDRRRVADRAMLRRLRGLAIPPAWTDVWIGSNADGHLLATGRDGKGRKQYIYHPRFRAMRDEAKYERLIDFAGLLPRIRETVARHMALRGLPREKVLATIVHLLETTLIRVGNEDYARQNKSYGLTTLRAPHVKVDGSELRFEFKGKSGRVWRLRLRDRRIAKVIKACQELPGQQLFQYIDDDGERRGVSSTDVNAYLRKIAGCEVTAKDFRTWAGTVLAALALGEAGPATSATDSKRRIRAAIDAVAAKLGNTAAICRKCYVHPHILEGYLTGSLVQTIRRTEAEEGSRKGLLAEEAAVLTYLTRALAKPGAHPALSAAA
ncbi:MAG: DNA topoisomerase IB [Rhodospirillaceae bacterium]|nr:DNA topoisomerase IB [Rhodospirillaceae bacterium]